MGVSYKPLFKLLIERDMKKTDLVDAVHISKVTLAKMSKGERVSLEVIERICAYFECKVEDIIEFIPEQGS